MKRRIILSTLLILIVICTMIGMSYAYYQLKLTDTHELITKTEIPSCFSLSLNSDSQITLTGDQSAPVSDIKALGSSNYQYSFSVSNGCANTSSVKVALTPSLDTDMPIRAIKYAVYEQNGTKPSEGTYLIDAPAQKLTKDIVREVKEQSQIDVETGYEILSLELNARETKTYNLYVWIDYYEGDKSQTGVYNNSTMNKSFIGSVVVTGYEDLGEYLFAYAIYSETDNSLVFYKNYDKPKVGETYNGKVTTAIFTGFETDEYTVGSDEDGNIVSAAPWYGYANEIQKVSVANEMAPRMTNFWFFRLNNVKSIDLTNLDMSQATSTAQMFNQAGRLSSELELNLGDKFDTSNVTTMQAMFQYTGYTDPNFTLDLGDKFNTSNVTNMSGLFALTGYSNNNFVLNLGDKFDTSKVTNMQSIFYGYKGASLDLGSKFDTSNVTNMQQMFYRCNNLISLDLSSWDTSKVTTMFYMFGECQSLETLDASNWDVSKVTTFVDMFYHCYALAKLDVSKWNTSSATDMAWMFSECESLTELDVSNFKTGKVTRMNAMFRGCKKLKVIDVSKWDTRNVIEMPALFQNAEAIIELDVTGWDTSKVTNMNSLFGWCSKLTKLDVSNFDTSNVTNMGSMFAGINVENLDLSNLDTRKVTDMNAMFWWNHAKTITFGELFITSEVTNMELVFCEVNNITTLDLSNWNTSKVTSMKEMFKSNSNLTTIYVSNLWNTSAVTDSTDMFTDSVKLVGGAGTVYDVNKVTAAYAKVDGGTASPGYFTLKV